MRSKLFLILFVLFALSLNAVIVKYDQLPQDIQASVIPDLEGYVSITEDFAIQHNLEHSTRELPSVHEGFPVTYSSPSNCYNGAIYCNMDDDEEMEMLFGVGKRIVALNLDGSAVPGWPVNNTYYIWSSPACGDIDGDGVMEIVATSRNNTTGNEGELYAYELDGTPCIGFPVTLAGGGTLNACLSDLDNDEDMEIFVNVRNHPEGWVYVFQGDGSIVEGWPVALDYVPGASISVADLDNDGTKEVIALSYNSLYVFDAAGNTLPGFPFTEAGTTVSYSQPTIYDMDGDGDLEILYGSCNDMGGKVFAFQHDGTAVTGWPKATGNWIFGTVSLGDIDGNGTLDVVVGDQVSSSEAANFIYAWDLAGNTLMGFPAGPTFAIYTQIAIADIDGDNSVELMIDDNRYGVGYECYNNDGTHCEDWPLSCGTAWSSLTMSITPTIGDFDNDGFLNIAGAATDIMAWVVETYVWDTNAVWNPDLAYTTVDGFNCQHDGLYPAEVVFVPEAPQNCQAYIENYNDLMVTWEAPMNTTPESYNVYLEDQLIAEMGVSELSYSHMGQGEGLYNFAVSANYPDEVESEIIDCAAVEIILPDPVNLVYEVLPTPQVNLTWDFPETRELSYFQIYRDGVELIQVDVTTYSDLDVDNETNYTYYVQAIYTGDHLSEPSNNVEVYVTSSEEESVPSFKTALKGNYPNPFNPQTKFSFSLANSGKVEFNIYNVRGELLNTLAAGNFGVGNHSYVWDASTKASGIYFIEIVVNGKAYNRDKALLIK